jgi:hypothetical protein
MLAKLTIELAEKGDAASLGDRRPEENEAEGAAELETEAGSNAFVAYWTGDGCDE